MVRTRIPGFILTAFLLSVFSTPFVYAQTATLSGYVVDAETKETLVGSTIVVRGTRIGTYTNKSGFFSLKDIPIGKQTIVVTSLGYERQELPFEFSDNDSKKITVEMKPKNVQGKEVVVTGQKEEERREIVVSKVDIPIQQLNQLRIGGESDVFRSLQYLPGVLSSSQISSGLYIRGGSPDQNLILIDGSTVYNPSHLLGFFSAFNPDAVKDVELIKGGFPAEYGGRASAVLNVTQKDGNRKELEGSASLGLISSRASLQGPVGNGSWFIGARRTYLDLLLGLLPKDPDNPLPDFNFYDLNGKIVQDLSSSDRVFLSGFMGGDNLGFSTSGLEFNIGISNRAGSLRWNHIIGDNLFTTVNLSASYYDNHFDANNSGYGFAQGNTISDYTLKATTEWSASSLLTLKGGVEATRFEFNYLQNFTGNKDSVAQSGTVKSGLVNLTVNDYVFSGFAQMNYQVSDLLWLQGGLRASYYDLFGRTTVDPRFAFRYQIQDNIALKGAWGIYYQYLHLASLPDFSFFDTWMPTDTTINPTRATHYTLSLETSPWDGYDLNIEGYYKQLKDINEINQYITDAKNVSDVFYSGEGQAYGFEVFLQKKSGDFTGWLGYALGFIESRFDSINGGKTFRPKYDRRHDLKMVAQYKLDDHWDIGASFTFQSGQSYTGVTSRFEGRLPGQTSGANVTVPAERYALRLPPSHQLNLNVNYNTTLFNLPFRLLLDVYNVYSRRDIWFRYFDASGSVVEVTDVRLLPILPTISAEIKF